MDIFDNLNLDRTAKVVNEMVSRLRFSALIIEELTPTEASEELSPAVKATLIIEGTVFNEGVRFLASLGYSGVAELLSSTYKDAVAFAMKNLAEVFDAQDSDAALTAALARAVKRFKPETQAEAPVTEAQQ